MLEEDRIRRRRTRKYSNAGSLRILLFHGQVVIYDVFGGETIF